jgi:hypothetical protein
MVVDAEGKGLATTRSGDRQERTAREPRQKCRNVRDDVKTAPGVSYSSWARVEIPNFTFANT